MIEEPRSHKVLRFAADLTLILATAAAFGLFIPLKDDSMIFNPTPVDKFVWNVFWLFPACRFIVIAVYIARRFLFQHTLSCSCVGG